LNNGQKNYYTAFKKINHQRMSHSPWSAPMQLALVCSKGKKPMTHSLSTFLPALEAHLERPMVFALSNGKTIPVGYHVTEFKALEYHTVDCGGIEHKFQETVIEIWRTALEQNRDYISVAKFLSIYNKVSPKVNFAKESDLIFLYGTMGEPAARYSVANLLVQNEQLIVQLEPDGVRCKAVERKADAILDGLPMVSGCCTPSNSSKVCC
jgi:hypothetical protein